MTQLRHFELGWEDHFLVGVYPDPGMPLHFLSSLQDVLMTLNDESDWIQINKFSEFDLPLVSFL